MSGSAASGAHSRPGAQNSAPEADTSNKPAEISPDAWQHLTPPVRDAVSALFARRATTQSVKNSVARLAGLDVAAQATQDIVALARKLPAGVVAALVDIAERAPTALDEAIALAGQNRSSTNEAVRKIRDIAAGKPAAAPSPQAQPWARFPLPEGHDLPADARLARRRDVDRVREADVVRTHLRPGLQRAADEAADTFHRRPPGSRFTGRRADTVDAARAAAEQATANRQENSTAELKKLESKAWKNYHTIVKRESGSEIHAVFEQIVRRDHDTLLGDFAQHYRLRTEAPYNINGRARFPGDVRPDLVLERLSPNGDVWYTAHTYDLKTGATGITGDWAFRVDRNARGLFEVEEIRPSSPGRPAGSGTTITPDGTTGMVADTGKRPNDWTSDVGAVARSTLRAADRYAGMRSVTPPSGDSQAFQVTDADGTTFAVTVETTHDGPAAVTYVVTGRNTVRLAVSSLAAPAQVPALVAGALAEAAARLSGHDAGRPDFLVADGGGEAVLSVRDHGRAARLLALDQVLRQSPLRFPVRARLTELIGEMGLAPDSDGVAARLAALPDQRMRDVVARHTGEPDGPLGTLAYLAKNVLPSVPVPVYFTVLAVIGGATPLIGGPTVAAIAITSLTKSLVQGLIDRSVAVREDAASGEQLGPRKRELRDQRMADLGSGFLRVMAGVLHGADTGRASSPTGDATGLDVVLLQLRRMYGLRRYTGAFASTAVLGALLLLTPLAPLAAAGIFAGTMAPAVAGTFLEASRKRYTMAVKAARTNELLSMMNDVVSGHRAHFSEQVRRQLVDKVRGRKFWYGDDAAGQPARALVPQSRAAVAKDKDPTRLAGFLHLSAEYAGFRGANAAVAVGVNLLTAGRQHDSEQAAAFELKAYDLYRDGRLDSGVLAAAVAEFVTLTAAAPDEAAGTPLTEDPDRPSGLPPRKWMAVGVGTALLTLGVAFGAEAVLGITGATALAAGGLASAVAEAGAGRRMTVKEQQRADRKAERDRVSALAERAQLAEALAAFGRDLRDGPAPRPATGDELSDRVLAARDRAYRQLADEVRRSLTTPDEVTTTFVQRVVALHDVAARAEQLAGTRLANHGQTRPEVADRNTLIAAIQKYNDIAPGVTTLPLARLFDGVHAGNAATTTPPHLPALPAGVHGQVAAVIVDRHLRDPSSPYRPPADLAALSGNEGWAHRLATAAGVPDGRFGPVAAFNDVVARLRQLGPGSRAIVHAGRTNHHSGGVASGDLVNAVNVGGEVFLIDATTGAPADVTRYADGLTMLVTEANGERAPASVRARVAGAYQNHVAGSFLTDPAAPGQPPGLPTVTGLRGGLARVINPVPGNDMPSSHAFSDQWAYDEEWPAPPPIDPAAGLGVAAAVAGMAAALLETFAGPDATGLPEFTALTELLRRADAPPGELFDAMTALAAALHEHELSTSRRTA